MALQLIVTIVGREALVNYEATGSNAVVITEMGVTTSSFLAANTLTALPDELKRIDAVAGVVTGGSTMNLVVRDDDADSYAAKGFGLYLDDGTLFAVTSSPTTILEKSALVSMLMTLDVAFVDVDASLIQFGDTNFANPKATADVFGIVELATKAEAEAGTDSERVITAAVLNDVVRERTVTGGGLVTGGGNLKGNRVLSVTEPTTAEALAGTSGALAMTPRRTKEVINALINGAPGALDTLLELATALGNDPNFATTVTNALATKAATAYVDAQLLAARTLIQSERRGDIVFRATQTVPAGAYECAGQTLNCVGPDAALFSVISNSYGGDGVTTFKLPDMRGQFPRGWDHGAGVDPGRTWASTQLDDFKSHNHSLPSFSDTNTGTSLEDGDGSGTPRAAVTGFAGGTETRPKNVAGMFIIWR